MVESTPFKPCWCSSRSTRTLSTTEECSAFIYNNKETTRTPTNKQGHEQEEQEEQEEEQEEEQPQHQKSERG
jgi:hypothetical protein